MALRNVVLSPTVGLRGYCLGTAWGFPTWVLVTDRSKAMMLGTKV